MPFPVTVMMLRARQGRCLARTWSAARPQGGAAVRRCFGAEQDPNARAQSDEGAVVHCVEDEDTAGGVTGRPERGKRCRSGH